jgi:myo-inositol-1(or 4)-monophosphatase
MVSIREVLDQAIRAAGDVLLKHYCNLGTVESKGGINLVTVADREAEETIIRVIRKAYPDHQILAEESGHIQKGETDYTWIIDPLDGTTNYSHSFPIFCVSIGVVHQDEIIMGGVYNPFADEYFVAEKGKGAWLNNQPIRVSSVEALGRSLVVTGFPYDRRDNIDHYLRYIREFLFRSHGVLRIGAAALDLCCVACGRLEGFWEEKLYPWDVAAGILIVREAGGTCTDFSGRPSSCYDASILATNGRVHQEMLDVLQH